MKLFTPNVLAALDTIASLSNPRSSLTAMACVLLEKSGDTLRLTTTDLSLWLRADIEGVRHPEEEDDWSACIPPHILREALETVDWPTVEIFPSKQGKGDPTLVIKSLKVGEKPQTTIETSKVGPDEFPPGTWLETTPLEPAVIDAILRVRGFESRDEARYILNGTLLDAAAQSVVATDGRRMAIVELDKEKNPLKETLLLRGTMTARLIGAVTETRMGIHKEANGAPGFENHDIHVTFKQKMGWGTLTMSGKTLRGNYPDWQKVVPSENFLGRSPLASTWNITALTGIPMLRGVGRSKESEAMLAQPGASLQIKLKEGSEGGSVLQILRDDRGPWARSTDITTQAITLMPNQDTRKGTNTEDLCFNPALMVGLNAAINPPRETEPDGSIPSRIDSVTVQSWGVGDPILVEVPLTTTRSTLRLIIMPMRQAGQPI